MAKAGAVTNPAPTGERGNILLPLRSGRTTAARSMRIACASRETVLSNPCLFVPEDRIPYIDSQLPALSTENIVGRASHGPGVCIPGHGFSRVSPCTVLAPRGGGGGFGEERPGTHLRGGWRETYGYLLVGRGNAPSPAPSPDGDIPTVHCTGDPGEKPVPGRFSPVYPFGKPASIPLPGTAFHRVSPRTALAPGRGRGRSAQRGRGGGDGGERSVREGTKAR